MKSLLLNLYNIRTLKVKACIFKDTALLNLHLMDRDKAVVSTSEEHASVTSGM